MGQWGEIMQIENKPPDTLSLARLFGLLADPTRLTILELLMQGVQCNCVIGDRLGLPMNLISHHLKVLKDAGLVTFSRDGRDARWIYYSVHAGMVGDLHRQFAAFLDPARIQDRLPTCGPSERVVEQACAALPRKISVLNRIPRPSRRALQKELT
jgi:ArsR family transcriptional regulator